MIEMNKSKSTSWGRDIWHTWATREVLTWAGFWWEDL